MLVNKASQYAIVIINELRKAEGLVRAYEIVQKHDLSPSFVDQICRRLRDAGILKSARGPGGGYSLLKEDVTALEIITLLSVSNNKNACPGALHIINSVNQALSSINV